MVEKNAPVYKPIFSISDKDLPAIKEWNVGKKYNMELEVEMVSISKGDVFGEGNKDSHEARFKILSIDSMPEENASVKK